MASIVLEIEGEKKNYESGITFEQVVSEYQGKYEHQIALVKENGKIRELTRKAQKDAQIEFITCYDKIGHKTYVRTAILMLVKAVDDYFDHDKTRQVKVECAIGDGYFVMPKGDYQVTAEMIEAVEKRMRQMVEERAKIRKAAITVDEARKIFREQGMDDKDRLFRFRRSSYVNVYDLDGYKDYNYGYMLPDAGYVKYFYLLPYHDGIILMVPNAANPAVVGEFEPRERLFEALMTSSDWGEKLGIDCVGDLNEKICAGEVNNLILAQEALQERRIGEIAQNIVERGGVKFVMIAGPSSSGKTTFSHRLSIQLASYGLRPHPIAVDDFFKNRADTPKDEEGNYNFECLEAIDIELFNTAMTRLLQGETVELPTFNFKTGSREYRGNFKTLGKDDILVIEGIHALNDKMSYTLPKESKYKIYISALTSLNIDEHNRISTTDGRLIRRMVRDARTRGASAQHTIGMWASVRRGEEENIFPFQEDVDVMFNSALIYELAVLKTYAEPLLFSVTPDMPEYYEAKRLLKFLDYFLSVSNEYLPINSIAREFAGGSCFNV